MSLNLNIAAPPDDNGDVAVNISLHVFPVVFIDTQNIRSAFMVFDGKATVNTKTVSYYVSLGIYSMTGTTLTLMTSLTGSNIISTSNASSAKILKLAATATTNTLAPGQYWYGMLFTSNINVAVGTVSLKAQYSATGWSTRHTSAIPTLVGGMFSVSTSDLPASFGTSDITRTGAAADRTPYIVLT